MNKSLKRQCYYGCVQTPNPEPAGLADQLAAAPFVVNENGFPDSDIVQLVNASSDAEFTSIASRLQEIKTQPEYKGLSNKDLIARVKPRVLQDPTELMRFVEYLDSSVLPQPETSQADDVVTPESKQETDAPTSSIKE